MGRSLNCLPRPMSWGLQLKEHQNSNVFFFFFCVCVCVCVLERLATLALQPRFAGWWVPVSKPIAFGTCCSSSPRSDTRVAVAAQGVDKRRKCDKGTILERYIMDHNGGFLWSRSFMIQIFMDHGSFIEFSFLVIAGKYSDGARCRGYSKTTWSYPAEKPAETRYWGKVDSCMPAFMVAGLFEPYGDMVV